MPPGLVDWFAAGAGELAGGDVRLTEAVAPCDVELTGTASDLMLHLWHRIPADHLEVKGDQEVLDRCFTLVPPV